MKLFEDLSQLVRDGQADVGRVLQQAQALMKSQIEVVCLFGKRTATQLIDDACKLGITSTFIVLLDADLSTADRRAMAKYVFTQKNVGQASFLVIDRVLALYLAMQSSNERLPAMLQCTLPYTIYQPFTNGSGSTADQMPDMESFYVEFIDVEDECPDIADVGRYLMEKYALPEIAAGYRGREKLQKYILDKQVLDNRVLWIKGMNAAQEKRWLQFCRDYVPAKDSDGRFVLEARWTDKESERRNLAVIRYGDTIKRYDLTLFNSIYLNREKGAYSAIWQQYAAVMCALLCNTDAETSQAFMETCDFTAEEPIIGMRKIAADGAYLRRGESNDQHILSLVRKENMSVIDTQIWKAQLQVLFPLLEIERVSFVGLYHQQIHEALGECYYDFKTGRSQLIYQFGDVISNPDDAELGTIYRMTKLKRYADTSQYLLYIPDEKSRSRIELLHDLRNALAHGEPCAIDKVAEFINGHPFSWEL